MDSPIEFGPISMREFTTNGRRFRFAMHHAGTNDELDALVKDVQKIVEQEGAVFGEYPEYEPGHYTFLADYLPYANGDGMEHRNSTVISGNLSIAGGRDRDSRHRRARVLSLLERRTDPPEGRSSRSTSIARTFLASSGWQKGSRSTTDRWRCSAPGWWTSRRPRQP